MISALHNFLASERIYNYNDISTVINIVFNEFHNVIVTKYDRRTKQSIQYINLPCAFDIETSSFYDNDNKVSIMYEWTFSFCGLVIIGRKWDEFITMINKIKELLQLSENRRLIIYCHNLAFEFQAMRYYFKWLNVFALDVRRPVYAVCQQGVEFRCSYILTNSSLAKVGENLIYFDIKKKTGDLNYKLIRHSDTPLTPDEIGYCVNDVRVVTALIAERIIQDGNITKIPLTQTGYVRRLLRKNCLSKTNRNNYLKFMSDLKLDVAEYEQLKRAFQGGFTHANPFIAGQTINNIVTSYDFTSSYPTVLISEQYPISACEYIPNITIEEFKKSLKYYCCVFDIKYYDLSPKIWQENPLSLSHCRYIENEVVNNGRVVSADVAVTTITNVDFEIYKRFYNYDHYQIANFRRYKKGYLPKPIVETVLQLYADKTTLKGVEGKEDEYLNKKECLNSCYGCMVMDVIQEDHLYNNDWVELDDDYNNIITPKKKQEYIDKYNDDKNRFLFYPWGVFVTAYARLNLFTGIYECCKTHDYLYSDTDSIKILNADKHIEYFNRYNAWITKRLIYAVTKHNLNIELLKPVTNKGINKPLGIWDFDGEYSKFKTLGAKRYLMTYSNNPQNGDKHGKNALTVAGLGKYSGLKYLNKYDNPYDHFVNNMSVPPEFSGRSTHTYIDVVRHGVISDYLGNILEYYEMSGTHLENSEYTLSMSQQYVNFILNIQERGNK